MLIGYVYFPAIPVRNFVPITAGTATVNSSQRSTCIEQSFARPCGYLCFGLAPARGGASPVARFEFIALSVAT